jgi:hypothetical protein
MDAPPSNLHAKKENRATGATAFNSHGARDHLAPLPPVFRSSGCLDDSPSVMIPTPTIDAAPSRAHTMDPHDSRSLHSQWRINGYRVNGPHAPADDTAFGINGERQQQASAAPCACEAQKWSLLTPLSVALAAQRAMESDPDPFGGGYDVQSGSDGGFFSASW